MNNELNGGNWYRVWDISGSYDRLDGQVITKVTYSSVIISDDEKMKTYTIPCTDKKQASILMRTVAFALDMAFHPLWVILKIRREELPPDILEYELKRCKHFGINII